MYQLTESYRVRAILIWCWYYLNYLHYLTRYSYVYLYCSVCEYIRIHSSGQINTNVLTNCIISVFICIHSDVKIFVVVCKKSNITIVRKIMFSKNKEQTKISQNIKKTKTQNIYKTYLYECASSRKWKLNSNNKLKSFRCYLPNCWIRCFI